MLETKDCSVPFNLLKFSIQNIDNYYMEGKLISTTFNSTVYKFYDSNLKRLVARKVVKTTNKDKIERISREYNNMQVLKDHECCVKFISSKNYIERDAYVIEIYTEFCEGGNLKHKIQSLQESNQTFGLFLFDYISTFINFFDYMQKIGLSHRDIKPENIFITSDGKMKIGDFGSSISTLGIDDFTIQGSPYFLSPELRHGYQNYNEKKGGYKIKHCPFKSDIFSLGLVFLSMAIVEIINDDFSGIEFLERAISNRLPKVKDPVIYEIIKIMVSIDVNIRPDFIQMKKIIDSYYLSFRCFGCKYGVAANDVYCNFCNIRFHKTCVQQLNCLKCFRKAVLRCDSCSIELEYNSPCSHRLCQFCVPDDSLCNGCRTFGYIKAVRNPQVEYRESITCSEDNQLCSFEQDNYTCTVCNAKFCPLCKKDVNNHEECLKSEVINFKCKCKLPVLIFNLENLFYNCSKCGFRCLICLKSINHEHSSCALKLQSHINS